MLAGALLFVRIYAAGSLGFDRETNKLTLFTIAQNLDHGNYFGDHKLILALNNNNFNQRQRFASPILN
jgi:hypothetical protein